jgi:hypothetical protein
MNYTDVMSLQMNYSTAVSDNVFTFASYGHVYTPYPPFYHLVLIHRCLTDFDPSNTMLWSG